ncbi:MAG: biotin synthase BioB [Fibrobacterota bacterium]
MIDPISTAQAREYMALPDEQVFELLRLADDTRRRSVGNRVSICSIVNAKSGNCSEDCSFCPQSHQANTPVETYSLQTPEQLTHAARAAAEKGAHNMGIVTAGRAVTGSAEKAAITEAAARITAGESLSACVSLGIIDSTFLRELKSAGVRAVHHNLESARSFYPQVCTTRTWEQNVQVLEDAKAAGLKVCSGGLFGLGESRNQRVELFDELRQIGVDSVPINFLNPAEGTRAAASFTPMSPLEALKIIAVARLMMPSAQIRIAGGREFTLRDMQSWIFAAGANALMVGNYLTTSGRAVADDLQMIRDAGMTLAENGGCGC